MKSGVRSASRAGNYESPNISLSNSISIAGMDIVKRAVFLGRYLEAVVRGVLVDSSEEECPGQVIESILLGDDGFGGDFSTQVVVEDGMQG